MPKIVREFKNLSEAINAYKHTSKCGIYSFQSKRGKHIYVGMSHNFGTRFIEHRKSYRNKHGEHRKLHEYFDKIGFDKTPVKILFESNSAQYSKRELYVIESIFIELYTLSGYNLLNGGMGQDMNGALFRHIGVKKYTRNGVFVEAYKNIWDCIPLYGSDTIHILRCCKCEIKTFKGYRWLIYNSLSNDEAYMSFLEKALVNPLNLASYEYERNVG